MQLRKPKSGLRSDRTRLAPSRAAMVTIRTWVSHGLARGAGLGVDLPAAGLSRGVATGRSHASVASSDVFPS